jgi:hypothetical protein
MIYFSYLNNSVIHNNYHHSNKDSYNREHQAILFINKKAIDNRMVTLKKKEDIFSIIVIFDCLFLLLGSIAGLSSE